ncbi:CNT_collapsed_G0015960.mRNA.1.CDS.1 [Saccharomyces cerevisiae]|nr:CNT_collapsed_G0015960.mRNA.1.CDS.1 [Saccharomyces cerevisiae]
MQSVNRDQEEASPISFNRDRDCDYKAFQLYTRLKLDDKMMDDSPRKVRRNTNILLNFEPSTSA